MKFDTPIYYANVTVEIVKNKQVIQTVVVPELIVKGFTTRHIVEHNMNYIIRKLAHFYKLGEKQIPQVKNIEYLRQMGYGINYAFD